MLLGHPRTARNDDGETGKQIKKMQSRKFVFILEFLKPYSRDDVDENPTSHFRLLTVRPGLATRGGSGSDRRPAPLTAGVGAV